jgi:hypothetical protein
MELYPFSEKLNFVHVILAQALSFHEDASRIENRHGAANFALFRKMALALLKQHPRKDSIARKRKTAALDPEFLAETLAGATKLEKV